MNFEFKLNITYGYNLIMLKSMNDDKNAVMQILHMYTLALYLKVTKCR